jgi:hypothetical protein
VTEFQSRLLYTQSSEIQHEDKHVNVSSTIYAIRFLYPGATQHTTSRIRITCTYKQSVQFESHAGIIERWSDKGWMFIDDYTGDVYAFTSEITFRKRLLDYVHSFIMGVPLHLVDEGYIADEYASPTSRKHSFRPYDIENKKTKPKNNNNIKNKDKYKIEESKSKKDDDDDSEDFFL